MGKKGKAPELTPEQKAAARAAAMAKFGGGATSGAAPKPAAAKANDAAFGVTPPPPAPTEAAAALTLDDKPPKVADRSDWIDDDDGDTQSAAAIYVASTLSDNASSGLSTKLPAAAAGWERLLMIETTPEMYKKSKKQGTLETIDNGCRLYHFKGIAFLADAEGRNFLCSWRTELKGANLGTGEQPFERSVGSKLSLLEGSDASKRMAKAIAAHTGASLLVLPTGHVQLLGSAEATAKAMKLVDDLVDGEGAEARETLAALLVVAAAWGGSLEVPCEENWVGAVIGKGGIGLKSIMNETGSQIEYVDPPEEEVAAAEKAEKAGEEVAKPKGHFLVRHKFEKDCRLAGKRIEERLALLQRLDVSGYVMVPRGSVGRLIGAKGANIKLLQRESGANRINFDKEPGGRATTQACTVQASDLEAAVGAAKVVLEAVPDPNASLEHKDEMKRRLEDWGAIVLTLCGGDRDAEKVAGATREMAVEAHVAKYGKEPPPSDKQTKDNPAELAAVDFDVWVWQWAVCQPLRAA